MTTASYMFQGPGLHFQRPAFVSNCPRPSGPPKGGNRPNTPPVAAKRGHSAFPISNKSYARGRFAPPNTCTIEHPTSSYPHRMKTASGVRPHAKVDQHVFQQSDGHPRAKTPQYNVPQSHWDLPKRVYTHPVDLDDCHSDTRSVRPQYLPNNSAPRTTLRRGVLTPGPTRTTACRCWQCCALRTEQRLAQLEHDELDSAMELSLRDEAIRQEQQWKEKEAAATLCNENMQWGDFDTGQWLSDASIARAYFELAAGSVGTITEEHQPLSDEILLMDPAVVFWLIHQDLETAELATSELNLQDKQLVLCPINDNANGGCADGGGHWTLLVAWRSEKEDNGDNNNTGVTFKNFKYYDSSFTGRRCNNRVHAEKLVHILSGGSTSPLRENSCAQQVNNYDCGVYVLAFSEIITSSFMEAKNKSRSIENEHGHPLWTDLIVGVSPSSITDVRMYYCDAFKKADNQVNEAVNQVEEADNQSTNHESQR